MDNRLLALSYGDVIELPDARGTTIRVTRGALWLTQERDRRDVLLTAGDAWTVERDGLTVAEARADTSLVIAGRSMPRTSIARHGRRWYERVMAWLRATAAGSLHRDHAPYV